MKKFDEYVAALDIKPVPTVTSRFAAYKGGEVKFFDSLKDATAFSSMYEQINNQQEIDARHAAIRYNSAQRAKAEKQFYADLEKETNLNKHQMAVIFEFGNEFDIQIDSHDNRADFVAYFATLIQNIKSLADKK